MNSFLWNTAAAGLLIFSVGCGSQSVSQTSTESDPTVSESSLEQPGTEASASVVAVETTETDSRYLFSVSVRSPDTGCDRYANWWEVITEEGTLLHRRILVHSHVEEQPFTRSGGFIKTDVDPDETIIVRVHMYPDGYSPSAMSGQVGEALEPITLPADFAAELSQVDPLPTGCGF